MFLRKVVGILLLALCLRVAAAVYWDTKTDGGFYFGDSQTYWTLAETIATGQPYSYEGRQLMRMPGYPVLLAPLFWGHSQFQSPSPPIFWARLYGALIGTATCGVVWLATRTLTGSRLTAIFATLFVATDPCQILNSVLILSEAPFTLFLALQLWFWILLYNQLQYTTPEPSTRTARSFFLFTTETQSSPRVSSLIRYSIGLGAVSCAAVYCRPSWLYFLWFAFFFTFVLMVIGMIVKMGRNGTVNGSRKRRRYSVAVTGFYGMMVATLVFCVGLSPWWIRNFAVCGHWVPTTLQLGASLYDGLRPDADGSSNMQFVQEFEAAERASPSMNPQTELFEYRVDHRMKQAAIHFATTHPDEAIRLAGVKFLRVWNIFPNEPAFQSWSIRLMMGLTHGPIFLLAGVGIFVTRKFSVKYGILWFPAVYITILHVIFVGSIRYRIPAMIGLDILAAIGLSVILYRIRRKNFHP